LLKKKEGFELWGFGLGEERGPKNDCLQHKKEKKKAGKIIKRKSLSEFLTGTIFKKKKSPPFAIKEEKHNT